MLHMVSLLQESTVQRLFRIECNTTFRKETNKKKNHFFMSLGIKKSQKFTFFPLLLLPKPFSSIRGTSQRYN